MNIITDLEERENFLRGMKMLSQMFDNIACKVPIKQK